MTSPAARSASQIVVLTRAFLARFFENESTAGRTDLRESFFWLVGGLAAPGMFFAVYEQFFWQFAARGPNAVVRLQAQLLHDKTVYLALTMVVMSVVTIATRNALIVDRRDALVLGVLPARPLAIVTAKFLALAIYVGVLSLGMHAGAAVLFGAFIGDVQSGVSAIRGAIAHLTTATTAGAFVFLSIVALECICVALAGPRRFARVATLVQMLLVVAVAATLFVTPALAHAAGETARGVTMPAWIASLPPVWFLGLYERLSGSTHQMPALAATAMQAIASTLFLVGLFYPLASRRILANAVTSSAASTRRWRRQVDSWLVTRLTTRLDVQAALQFLIATAGRVGRFRLTMAGAIGVGMTLTAPLVLFVMTWGLPARPAVVLLIAPLLLSAAVVAGWRTAASMPSELGARWMFLAAPLHGLAGRTAIERIAIATGVLIPIAITTPIWIGAWGISASAPFIANALIAGVILVDAHTWGYSGVPCTRPLAVSESNIQGRWPFYLGGLLAYAAGVPAMGVWLADRTSAWVLTAVLLVVCLVVRRLSGDAAVVNALTNDQRGLILLDLALVAHRRGDTHLAPPTTVPAKATEVPRA